MSQHEPIFDSHLFRELHGHLLVLLRSLMPEDWRRPTVCSAWCVKDIASHLLETSAGCRSRGMVTPRPTHRVASTPTKPWWRSNYPKTGGTPFAGRSL